MAEQITIECPLCGEMHVYGLTVVRAHLIGLGTPGSFGEVRRSFDRLFACPTKGGRFEATVHLYETSLNRIEQVQVQP